MVSDFFSPIKSNFLTKFKNFAMENPTEIARQPAIEHG